LNLPLFIAKRYFLSKRKKNFINMISILSMIGVAFSTAALIIVLSVFNGLEDLLRSLNTSFDPEIKIEAVKGKSFEVDESLLKKIKAVAGVDIVTEVIEDYAYLRYRDAEMVVTIKGVSDNFLDQKRLDDHIVEGNLHLQENGVNYAIVGRGVQYALSIAVETNIYPLQVFYIKNVKASTLDVSQLYSRKDVQPSAVFSIEKNFDENNIFLPLHFVRDLLDYGDKRTSLEVKAIAGTDLKKVQSDVRSLLGPNFSVLTNEEQHKDIYKLLKMEKLFVFFSITLLIIVASINIFFSLMMLAIDKKKDISILSAVGAGPTLIKRIFLSEGALIALVGMGMENALVTNYPVKLRSIDFVTTSLVIVTVTFLISFYPASLAARSFSTRQL
jgi:lipoprotein-releasing system permease protein